MTQSFLRIAFSQVNVRPSSDGLEPWSLSIEAREGEVISPVEMPHEGLERGFRSRHSDTALVALSLLSPRGHS
jgi:hypothetical protein